MNAYIVIGCHGRKNFGLTMCPGTSNIILDLRKVSDENQEVFEYLDNHCKLFDKIATDLNKIGNIINYLSNRDILPNHFEKALYDYIAIHKRCGIFLYIEPIVG